MEHKVCAENPSIERMLESDTYNLNSSRFLNFTIVKNRIRSDYEVERNHTFLLGGNVFRQIKN